MKVDEHKRLHQSTVGQGIKMSIDESATAHIMDVLTKLYSNPRMAVLREYSTNAWDSHRQAGNPAPIEVTLPTSLSPTLVIRDEGIGLDAEDIENIYSRYGTSTKRDSNEAVGMLGLGCKSALAYGSQFTLEGRKDGVKTAVLISRDEDGAGSMTPVSIEDTDEPNGVTVSIPIKASDIHTITSEAQQFFRFWPKEDVLVNGAPLAHEWGGIWLNDRILLTEDVKEDLVVMGNVPYPLVDGTKSLSHTISYHWHAVCFVDIGAVNFAPSRESLMTTRRTTATLDHLRSTVTQEFERSVQDQIANAKDAKEAQGLLMQGQAMGFKGKAVWKGREVLLTLARKAPTVKDQDWRGHDIEVAAPGFDGSPDEWSVENALKYSYLFANNSYGSKNGTRKRSLDLTRGDVWVFTGFDGKALTNVKRAKLELWFQQNAALANAALPNRLPQCVFVDKLSEDEKFWLKGWKIKSWSDVDAIVLPKSTTDGGTRLKGSYDCLIAGRTEYGVAATKIQEQAKTLTLYWVHGNYGAARHHRAFKASLFDPATCIVVCLGANRIEKFKRDFPNAKKLDDAAKEAAERWVTQQNDRTRKAYSVQRRCNVEVLKTLDVTQLDDPELKELHALANVNTSTYVTNRQAYSFWVEDVEDTKAEAWADKLLERYPLYQHIGRYDRPDKKHIILYLNAAYAARQKGGI